MKVCAACHTDLPKESYSKKQWKLDEYQRRCKVCITNNREVQPIPEQDNNYSNTNEIIKSLDSMCMKDVEKISDEELFKQPPPADDCPICFLRMPTDEGWRYKTCCGKVICCGCIYAVSKTKKAIPLCPFCRTPHANTDEEMNERDKRRMEAGVPIAIHNVGCYYDRGTNGYSQDHTKALELWHRAAELGYTMAYASIGYAYDEGEGIEVDKTKAVYYYELAAMRGNVYARHNLGNSEMRAGNIDRVLRHYMIAVRDGYTKSLNSIKELYTAGHATKDDYMKALQSYQEYLSEIKSPQRDKAAAYDNEEYRYY